MHFSKLSQQSNPSRESARACLQDVEINSRRKIESGEIHLVIPAFLEFIHQRGDNFPSRVIQRQIDKTRLWKCVINFSQCTEGLGRLSRLRSRRRLDGGEAAFAIIVVNIKYDVLAGIVNIFDGDAGVPHRRRAGARRRVRRNFGYAVIAKQVRIVAIVENAGAAAGAGNHLGHFAISRDNVRPAAINIVEKQAGAGQTG